MIRPAQMPYKNPMGKTYDVGQFERVLDLGLAHAQWDGTTRAARFDAHGKLARPRHCHLPRMDGRGGVRGAGDGARVADGAIEIFSATQPMGTSLDPTFIAARGRRVRRAARKGFACATATPIAARGSAARARARCSSAARPCTSRRSAP
jgi:hypothetical protein